MPIKRNSRRRASQFIREEMRQRGRRSQKQAIAIGLSRARAAGIKVPAPRRTRRNPRDPDIEALHGGRIYEIPESWLVRTMDQYAKKGLGEGQAFLAAVDQWVKEYKRKYRQKPLGDNPPASSPAGAGRLIYPRVLYVVAQKDPRGRDNHPCDAACRRANHTYKHSYAGRRPPVAAYGRQNDVVLSDFKGW